MGVKPAVITKGADRDTTVGHTWKLTARAILKYSNGQTAVDDLGDITAALSPAANDPPQDLPTEHEWTPAYAPVEYDGSANMMEVRLELTGAIMLDGEVIDQVTILSKKYWADETDPGNPVPPTVPSIEDLRLFAPAEGSENMDIELDADADAAGYSWEVRASLYIEDISGGEATSDKTEDHGKITSFLNPVPGSPTDLPTMHAWATGYVRSTTEMNTRVTATITAIIRDANGNNISQAVRSVKWTSSNTMLF